MGMPLDIIPEEFQEAYRLKEKAKRGFVYMETQKGMYGLPQDSIYVVTQERRRIVNPQ